MLVRLQRGESRAGGYVSRLLQGLHHYITRRGCRVDIRPSKVYMVNRVLWSMCKGYHLMTYVQLVWKLLQQTVQISATAA